MKQPALLCGQRIRRFNMANAAHEQLREELKAERATAIRLQLEKVECENLLYTTGHWTPNDERHAGVSVPEAIRELIAENREMGQTLLNEQGKGEPPSEGWEWDDGRWATADGPHLYQVLREENTSTTWELYCESAPLGTHPTARAAMRAADNFRG
jgi:hypothetical protein